VLSCTQVFGGSLNPAFPSPLISAVLTINTISVEYGPGLFDFLISGGGSGSGLGASADNGTFTNSLSTVVRTPSNGIPFSITTPFSYTVNHETDNLPNGLGGNFFSLTPVT
jgi:hypothetical protein